MSTFLTGSFGFRAHTTSPTQNRLFFINYRMRKKGIEFSVANNLGNGTWMGDKTQAALCRRILLVSPLGSLGSTTFANSFVLPGREAGRIFLSL